jgi:hypothetical protein
MFHLLIIFLKMIEQVDNREFFRDIYKEELCGVLESFKKDKSPGPDSWTIDFY